MSKLVSKIVNQVQDVQKIVSIPKLKEERDALKIERTANNTQLDHCKKIESKYEIISQTTEILSTLNVQNILSDAMQEHSNSLIQYLTSIRDNNTSLKTKLEIEQQELDDKIEKIKKKIENARKS